ncbi:MAG: EAL domain-containing protein [Porticoccus sp.]|nr:EAL domain-containing protein [Porticoccus sp.]MBQ0807962.1 EAL domain-containing protein [Porticoccus sp.]
MAADNALKLLLTHDSVEEANRVVSLLRNANYRSESKHVNNEDVLKKLLQDKSWDLVIAQFNGADVPIKSIFSMTRKLNLDTPVVLISDEYDPSEIVEGLRLGAADVIPMDEDQHLLLSISRTLYDLEQRRRLRTCRRRYSDAETRCDRLLSSSEDAIAIVQEGTYLFANESYSQLFGYLNDESMLCLPVIDNISPEDRPQLKKFLKPIEADEEINTETLRFTGMTNNEIPVPIELRIAKVDYQNEPALEFLITKTFLENQNGSLGDIFNEKTSGSVDIQRDKVIELINGTIRQAAQKHNTSVLLYITIDRYQNTQHEVGLQKTEDLVWQLIEKIESESKTGYILKRFKEDSFVMILPSTGADAGLIFATHLCEYIDQQVFELDKQTLSLTLGIGATVISETVTTAESCIEHALSAITELHGEKSSPDFANAAKLYESGIGPEFTEDDVESIARTMLAEKQFELLYQPIIPLHGDPQEYYEVLMQVAPEAQGAHLPDNFIAKVFKTPTAIDIDHWVILESIKTLSVKLKTAPSTRLFINISGHSIADEGFTPWLKVALKASGLLPRHVVFQLREIDVARQFHRSAQLIEELCRINGDVALSHFGLAIEPMKLLKKLSVNFVKFDSVIIERANENEDGVVEVEGLINALKGENEQIIVPFVERAEMIPTLWRCGVHYIQGHFLQPPSPVMNYDFSDEN